MSPTQRSRAWCEENGFISQIVEHWNSFARRRIDLFNCIDILAVRAGETGCLGIQTTSDSNVSARLRKACAPGVREKLNVWLSAGNRFVIQGWGKKGPRGKRKTWLLREVTVTQEMLARPLEMPVS